ncbi:DNA methyltransferase [Alcanivorax sp.]|uniref:site-specific DNA-methyltransferase n=1 Tax=Alcanivorax sp. TaxID=1872427 RepID=UPI0025BE7279|nr:DNA methyltransferase [Alcanivorax sp.]
MERGGDKPYHTIINAENFHALQTLLYTHEGKLDAIYIDPPYNTGAKDWKYNNDYVEADDAYRHSKWLAMIERRLKLAKRLLNPENSVLIVTIDEKEYLRLGMLLEQTFPSAEIQMVATVISQRGVVRDSGFSRVDEYIFFITFGNATAALLTKDLLGAVESSKKRQMWYQFRRNGAGSLRADSPNLFYPLLVDPKTRRIVEIGDPLPANQPRESYAVPKDLTAVWPLRENGVEARWRTGVDIARRNAESGYLRVGKYDESKGVWSVLMINEGGVRSIEEGEISIVGRAESGEVILGEANRAEFHAKSVWNSSAHDAGWHGSRMLASIMPGRRFPYPKSLYAVEDALRLFISDKPNATILDFFSGSGTTAHAVMRLNKQDGGQRQCISITNNEVSADEQKTLREKGLRPGDAEWEALGICDYITKPRIRAAITGQTPEGEPIKGDYKFTDEFPMADGFEENAEFFTLTYEAPRPIAHNKSFSIIAPLLWLKAGARGKRIDKRCDDFAVADTYGVLFDLDVTAAFIAKLHQAKDCRMAFIVTDDDRGFQTVCAELPPGIEAVRLYESYLTNFTINTGRD